MPDHAKAFDKRLDSIGGGQHQRWRLFSDFCEMSACAIDNGIIGPEIGAAREKQYAAVRERYDAGEAAAFNELFGITVLALEDEPGDFLGQRFQALELANHWHGQYFTPFELCRLMAAMTLQDAGISRPN